MQASTLYDVFKGNCTVQDALRMVKTGLDILTVGLAGTAADMELAGRTAREYMLSEALQGVSDKYDYCVIDTAPTLGLLTLNALTAADYAIIPMNLEVYSIQGMEQLEGFISNVRKYTNNALKVSGLLLTRYNERLNLTQALKGNVEKAAEVMKTVVYDSRIRESVAVRETQLLRSDIYTEAPKATATLDYIAFVDEFMNREVETMVSKKSLEAAAATSGMFTAAKDLDKKQGKKQEPKRETATFSVKIDTDVLKKWRIYASIDGYGDKGKLTEAALNEYMNRHKLTPEQQAKFDALMSI